MILTHQAGEPTTTGAAAQRPGKQQQPRSNNRWPASAANTRK
jgi:uncharacterized protein (DUF2345 family)